MKRRIKGWLAAPLFRRGLHRPLFRNRAVVVAFHRVLDGLGYNPISCTPSEFRAYCDFFAACFDVIPLAELMRRLRTGEDISGTLVITFDDGYRDNLEIAAPELLARNLPATFFVATDFIESDYVPWWDAERGVRTEWMSWSQVRELVRLGFEIGAHTRTHVDLGVLASGAARTEISGSRERLEQELGVPVRYFSYPYGRVHQISNENRNEVRAAGFECCFSCHGGSVQHGDDNFHLLRTPVSPWYRSPWHLGFELAFQHR